MKNSILVGTLLTIEIFFDASEGTCLVGKDDLMKLELVMLNMLSNRLLSSDNVNYTLHKKANWK